MLAAKLIAKVGAMDLTDLLGKPGYEGYTLEDLAELVAEGWGPQACLMLVMGAYPEVLSKPVTELAGATEDMTLANLLEHYAAVAILSEYRNMA